MLQISNLHKTFARGVSDRTVIFSGLDLKIPAREFTVVVGSNGAGKSTLLNIITGTDLPDAGRLSLEGRDITSVPPHLRSRWIGRVYQDPSLGVAPSMTVMENLALAGSRGGAFKLIPGARRKDMEPYIHALTQLDMGLEQCLNQKAGQLSGGQKQALALTMVVMTKPRLLLLDEHTAALDPGAAERIKGLTAAIIADSRLTAIMVTHDLAQAIAMGDRLIMLDRGKIILDVSGRVKDNLTISELMTFYEPAGGEIAAAIG